LCRFRAVAVVFVLLMIAIDKSSVAARKIWSRILCSKNMQTKRKREEMRINRDLIDKLAKIC
jgi:hypothetical protein